MDYFISDHHFNHANIIKYASRNFENVGDMNSYMIEAWNSVVSSSDTVYHLGDFSFNLSDDEISGLLKKLNGDIILIRGNHDRIGKQRLINIGFKDVYNKYIYDEFILTHRPLEVALNGLINIHGHTHSYDLFSQIGLNVGVEALNYKPISINEIRNIII